MIRTSMLLLLACSCSFAAGRLELFSAPFGAPEQAIQSTWRIGMVPATDRVSARLRLRNTGDAAVNLTTLRIAGTAFSMTGAPSLPFIVAPGLNVDFTVEFRPQDAGSYSGNLLVNSAAYLVLGEASAVLGVFRDGVVLASGETVDFGRVQAGTSRDMRFEIRNGTSEPAGVSRATVSGPAFLFPNGTPTPYLQPGQAVSFTVTFHPSSPGIYQERLVIDSRTFLLTGTSYDPPLPRPTLAVDTPVLRSGDQGSVSVRLADKAATRGTGTVRMELRPDGKAADNDGAARFVSGSREVTFAIAPGDLVYTFPFQTGTTTGLLIFSVEAGGYKDQVVVGIAPETVRIDKALGTRRAGSLDVQITGFDNTRTVSDMNFTFYSTAGQPLAGMPVRVAVSREFERWWAESKLGGIFSFRAAFPVSGDAAQIGSVEVEIINSVGTSRTQRLSF